MVTKSLQDCSEVFLVLFFTSGVYKDIIDEDHHKFIQEIHEHFVHHMHEESRGTGEAEGHNGIFIKTVSGSERGLRNIFLLDFELVIPGPQINLGEYFCSTELIKLLGNVVI